VNQSPERLRELVKTARGEQSQRKFAEGLGVSWTSVHAWEKGKRFPDRENIMKIAAKAGMTYDQAIAFLNEQEVEPPTELQNILTSIKFMPLKDLALVGHAIADRLLDAS
jgi:transcriptional regulator with XRE-family HTH domain